MHFLFKPEDIEIITDNFYALTPEQRTVIENFFKLPEGVVLKVDIPHRSGEPNLNDIDVNRNRSVYDGKLEDSGKWEHYCPSLQLTIVVIVDKCRECGAPKPGKE